MTILYAEVRPRLSGEEAELCVLRFTGCVRDAPQRVRHLHALEHRKQKKEKIIIINNKTDKLYFYVRQLTYTFRVFRERNANKMFNMFKFKFERYMREDPSF